MEDSESGVGGSVVGSLYFTFYTSAGTFHFFNIYYLSPLSTELFKLVGFTDFNVFLYTFSLKIKFVNILIVKSKTNKIPSILPGQATMCAFFTAQCLHITHTQTIY